MYEIILSDGTKISNLELNGNNYIATNVINDSVFTGKLGKITISDGTNTETFTDMVLVQNKEHDGGSWFILAELSPYEKEKRKTEQTITNLETALTEVYELIQPAGGTNNG